MMPPFARLQPPTGKIPEEVELVWDDTVAPETCIDFDAPHVSTEEVLGTFGAALAFFVGLYAYVSLTDPVASNPVATRHTVIPPHMLNASLALATSADGEEEEEED